MQDLEVEQVLILVLLLCVVSSIFFDWYILVEVVLDSISDLYNFQVLFMFFIFEVIIDEDEEGKLFEDIMKFLEQLEWQLINVDGKGYLFNEFGVQFIFVYGDFSCKEELEIDSLGGDIGLSLQCVFIDLKNMDVIWLDSLLILVWLFFIQVIFCVLQQGFWVFFIFLGKQDLVLWWIWCREVGFLWVF